MFPLFKRQCKRIRPELWDYLAERLPEGTLETIERHLNTCESCRNEAESLRRTQNLLLTARLEEPPTPRHGWNDLQNRLEQGIVATYTPQVTTTEIRTQNRMRWIPSMAMVGSCLMLFCSAGLTYRTLSLQQRVVQVPVPMMISQAPQNANPVKAKEPQPTPFSSVNAPLDTASLRTPTKPQPNVNAQTHLKSTPKEAAKDGGIYMVPANYLSNPEITEPAPKPSTLQFTRHKPQVSERTKNAQPDKEYIMGTLTPVSHDSDSAY